MTPVGGLLMVVHLLIISLHNKKKALLSLAVILVVWGVLTNTVLHSVKALLGEGSNIHYLMDRLEQCKPLETTENKNKIVLRVDDVQAFAWRETTIKMIDEAMINNMPMVLGIVPAKLQEDSVITRYLKKNHCRVEIAQHGWNHQSNPPEFSELDEEEAYQLIIKGKAVLKKITDFSVVTFIPPHNIYSEGTRAALARAGFLIVSSEGESMFDFTTSTYNSSENRLNPVSEVVGQCKEGLNDNNLCVIMLHPQDYTTDNEHDDEKHENYLELLSELKKLDASFVVMKDIIN